MSVNSSTRSIWTRRPGTLDSSPNWSHNQQSNKCIDGIPVIWNRSVSSWLILPRYIAYRPQRWPIRFPICRAPESQSRFLVDEKVDHLQAGGFSNDSGQWQNSSFLPSMKAWHVHQAHTLSCNATMASAYRYWIITGGWKTYKRIPGSGAKAHSVIAHAETADPVLMAIETSNPVPAKDVPNLEKLVNGSGNNCYHWRKNVEPRRWR